MQIEIRGLTSWRRYGCGRPRGRMKEIRSKKILFVSALMVSLMFSMNDLMHFSVFAS